MTENLLTGTLSINTNKQIEHCNDTNIILSTSFGGIANSESQKHLQTWHITPSWSLTHIKDNNKHGCQLLLNLNIKNLEWAGSYTENIKMSQKARRISVVVKPAMLFGNFRNDPQFSDRLAWANSADPDQTAPRGAV